MKIVFFLAAALAAGAGSANAVAIQLSNTGVDDAGVVLNNGALDTHYALISAPVGAVITTPRVATSANGFPIPPWVGDDSASAWIGPNSGAILTGPAGDYDYRTTFSIGAGENLGAKIAGRWSSDNSGVDILINGVSTAQTNPVQFVGYSPFSVSSGFVVGLNTLDFIVNNASGVPDDQNPSGLRVEMTGNAVPEPAAWALMLVGFGGLGSSLRRTCRSSRTV